MVMGWISSVGSGSELLGVDLAITTDSQRPWLVSRRVWAQAGLSLA